MTALTVDQFNKIIEESLPFAADLGLTADHMAKGEAVLRLPYNQQMLRPGGTISGPTMMAIADACMYAVVLSEIGPVELAVTTNFNINFLFRPAPADLIAEGRTIKLGKRLAVVEVTVHSDGKEEPVAHATGTYSIPPGAVS